MTALLQSLHNSHVTFLIGQNGSGKSRRLGQLALQAMQSGRNVIAISNTVFDRFPVRRWPNYNKLSPSRGSTYALDAFKVALCKHDDEFRTFEQITKVFDYAGYDPVLTVEIRLDRDTNEYAFLERILQSDAVGLDIARYLAQILDNENAFALGFALLTIDLHERSSRAAGILNFIRYEKALRSARVVQNLRIHVARNGKHFPVNGASSGELTVLASYAFLATHIQTDTIVLIDEPENSLHPKWQSEYCKRLLDQFYLYHPKFLIATHAPLVVSGAMSDDVGSQIFVMPEEREEAIDALSIDGLLMEVFGVLPPASHHLSERVSELLNKVQLGAITLDESYVELARLSNISYDRRQREFLAEARKLAAEIISYRAAEIDKNEN
jgi:predicted ATPase